MVWESIPNYSLIGVAVAIIIVVLDFYLLRKGKMQGRGFVLWLLVAATLGLFSGIPPLFALITVFFGTENIVNAILAAGLLFFLLTIFYLYYRLSEMHSLLMKLAMEVSVKRYSESESGQDEQSGQQKDLKTKHRKNTSHEEQ